MSTPSTFKRERAQRYDLAARCEKGEGARCKCRCRGEKHGARRVNFDVQPLGLASLPPDDPHYVPVSRHPDHVFALVEARKEVLHV